jgi:hypothetical protein
VGVYLYQQDYFRPPVPVVDSSGELSSLLEPKCPSGVVLGTVLRVVPPDGLPHLLQLLIGLGDRLFQVGLGLDELVLVGDRGIDLQQPHEELCCLDELLLRVDGVDVDPQALGDELRRLEVLLGEVLVVPVDHRDAVGDPLGALAGYRQLLLDFHDPQVHDHFRVGDLLVELAAGLVVDGNLRQGDLGIRDAGQEPPVQAAAGERIDVHDALDADVRTDGGLDQLVGLGGGHDRLLQGE